MQFKQQIRIQFSQVIFIGWRKADSHVAYGALFGGIILFAGEMRNMFKSKLSFGLLYSHPIIVCLSTLPSMLFQTIFKAVILSLFQLDKENYYVRWKWVCCRKCVFSSICNEVLLVSPVCSEFHEATLCHS